MSINKNNSTTRSFWYPSLVGFCLFIIGLGLGRFAYAPVIPPMIHAHWVSLSQAGYLGTANFFGYAIGAFTAYRMSRWLATPLLMRLILIFSVLSLFGCMLNWGFWWLSFWRFVIGITGAFITVLTVSTLLQFIEKKNHSVAAGIMFAGTGFAIVVISLMVGPLAKFGVSSLWLGFGIFGLIAAIIIWPLTGKMHIPKKTMDADEPCNTKLSKSTLVAVILVGVMYFTLGPGTVPHLLFLATYMHQVLHASVGLSGSLFSLLGIGVAIGGVSGGVLAKGFKAYGALIIINVIGLIAVLLVLFSNALSLAAISGFLMGWYVMAAVAATSLRVFDFVPASDHAKFFGRFTLSFAVSQFLTSYVVSYLLHGGTTYYAIFVSEAVALILAIVLAVVGREWGG